MAVGIDRYCGIAKEAAYGGIVAAADWIDLISGGVKEENQFILPETGQGWDPYHGMLGAYKCEGSLEAYLNTETFGHILTGILGADTPVGAADPYTHTFKSVSDPEPLSLYIGDVVTAGEQQVTSAMIKKLEIECVAGELVTWNVDFFAQQCEQATLQASTFDTLDPITFFETDFQVGGGTIKTTVGAVKLTIERGMADDEYSLGSRVLRSAWGGPVKVTWEVDLYFDALTEWKRFYDGSTGVLPGTTYTAFVADLNLTRLAVNDELLISCDKTVWDVRDANIDRRSRTMEKITGHSYYDETLGCALQAILYGATPTY